MRFSIVVPIYKVEQYLPEVIQSIQEQSYTDFEVLLIDDGSPDKCGSICDDMAQNDSRFRAIHQVNGGLGVARNRGIIEAKGEYLYFLDGDDRLADNVLKDIDANIQQYGSADIIASNEHDYTDWKLTYIRKESNHLNLQADLETLKQQLSISAYVGHNFYRRDFIIETTCLFSEERKVSEDSEWHLRLVSYAKTIHVLNRAFYLHYEGRPGSQVNGFKKEFYLPTLSTWGRMFRQVDRLEYRDKENIKMHIANTYWRMAAEYVSNSDSDVSDICLKYVKENQDILLSQYCSAHLVLKLSTILGWKRALQIARKLENLKNEWQGNLKNVKMGRYCKGLRNCFRL